MSKTTDRHVRRIVSTFMLLVLLGPAFAQSPPSSAQGAPKPPADNSGENAALRIRGIVEQADEGGVVVQLSKGINIRADIGSEAACFSATRIAIADLQQGEHLAIRARAAQAAGDTTSALEVLSVSTDQSPQFAAPGVTGVLKAIERTDNTVLVVTEGGADRRLSVTKETSFWRLKPAALKDVKPGMSISVLITRDASGATASRRVVFASGQEGVAPPL